MTTPEREEFLEAQRRMLSRHGVEAGSRFVPVPAAGGRAHVLEVGEGRDVVMLTGLGTPAAVWAPLMAELGGLRLLAVDLPGHGLTDTRDDLADDLRKNAVAFLRDTLDALELSRPAFVGNSLGSLWAIWLALERPERVGAMVHVGCPAGTPGTVPPLPLRLQSVRPLGRLLVRLQPPSPGQVEQLAKMVGEHPLTPALVDLLVATERLPDFVPTFLSTLHALLRLRGFRPRMELTDAELARLEMPNLVVWGSRDPFGSPEAGGRMAAVMPDAAVRLVDGGHAPWLDEPGRVGRLTRSFLASSGRRA